ncbi:MULTISPECIES: hypothetical protein [Actinomadura]|uniref:hypothetical protein n=1 Tax=Actinomadura TaxID=1988 RepID=UPI0004250022|nr:MULTISPECIES: hypothetical protein [Actinomadura]RSN54091.1 hypothetical protein DMH08_27080 [Actinomadura sp. WAC 06369]
MTIGQWSDSIPGNGTFFVGIDIAPGRYLCTDAKGGWWVRYPGPGGGEPVASWPLPEGGVEIEIAATDVAFETHTGADWKRVGGTAPAGAGEAPEPRPVADPALRAELDAVAARGVLPGWLVPASMLMLGLIGSTLLGPFWLLGLGMLAVMITFGSRSLAPDIRRVRELERNRDRYRTLDDFDAEGRAMLARAQAALDAVRDSRVNREGLLDSADNAVMLPRQEWEIAQVLARQSKLRADHAAMAGAAAFPEVEAALRPLREKLELSVESVDRRIEALERYAERVRAADEALEAHRRLEEIAAKAHEYDELVADTVRDDLAIPAIDRLTEQSEALIGTLRERLTAAAEAADQLPPAS